MPNSTPSHPVQVSFHNSSTNASLDAFKRLRVSDTYPLFACKNIYDSNPLLVDNIVVGGGSAVFNQPTASVLLSTGTAAGDKVTRRSRQWIKYQPGSSQLIKITGVLGERKQNLVQRIGYFDDNNGFAFVQTSEGNHVLRRTSTSGTVVDNLVPQNLWNIDKLDGHGPSGISISATLGTLAQIFIIDFEWLSVGRVRWGIDLGYTIVYVHEFSGVNNLSVPNVSSPDLPVTWEIENVGEVTTPSTLMAICASVQSEGGQELKGFKFSQSSSVEKSVAVAAGQVPVISIRPKLLFGGRTNRTIVVPLGAWGGNSVNTADIIIRLWYNTTLTGANWVSQSSNSACEYDLSATAVNTTTGELLDTFFIAGIGNTFMDAESTVPLTLNALGNIPDTLTITVQTLVGTAQLAAGIDWKEWR